MADKPKQGGLEAKVADAPKIGTSIDDLKKKGENIASTIDGFLGDSIRTGTTTYAVASTLPAMLVNPIAGAFYAGIYGWMSYVGSNLIYKLFSGTIKVAYDTITNPLGTVKKVTEGIKDIAANPLGIFKKILSTPEIIYKHLFEGGNHNKYGQIVGTMLGGGLALNMISPNLFNDIAGASTGIEPVIDSVKEGLGAIGQNISDVGEISKDFINKLKDYVFINDPLSNLAGNAHNSGFAYK